MVARRLTPLVRERARKYPVLTLTGPRQSGKTTLCRGLFPRLPYLSLESADQRREYGASHIFRSVAKGHNGEVNVGLP